MNHNITHIIDHLFQKQTVEDVDVRDIEQLRDKYPYYAPLQYLLTKKYQQPGVEQYSEQVKKAALYFTNPHWLNALLHPEALPADEAVIEVQPEEAYSNEAEPEIPVVEIKDNDTIIEPILGVAEKEDLEKDEEIEIDSPEDLHLPETLKLPTGDFSLAEAKAAFIKPLPDDVTVEGGIIPIEPLHTVDYFASQGIRVNPEYEGKDKLSQKLKSFTEWLKTMKKIHPEKLESEMDGNTQAAIQHMAEHSNEQKETVTEAMAEVFARQGMQKKAIETYQKLSLLNPDKRVYFAAKISKLNEK